MRWFHFVAGNEGRVGEGGEDLKEKEEWPQKDDVFLLVFVYLCSILFDTNYGMIVCFSPIPYPSSSATSPIKVDDLTSEPFSMIDAQLIIISWTCRHEKFPKSYSTIIIMINNAMIIMTIWKY